MLNHERCATQAEQLERRADKLVSPGSSARRSENWIRDESDPKNKTPAAWAGVRRTRDGTNSPARRSYERNECLTKPGYCSFSIVTLSTAITPFTILPVTCTL